MSGAGMMDIVMLVILLGGAYFLLSSGVLNNIGGAAATPVVPATTTPTDTTTTTPATTTPASTGNPLLDALNKLLGGGTGGINTVPPVSNTPPEAVPTPQQQPTYQGNPAECKSRYNGKCDTECKSGNSSLCNACQIACGGAAVGAVQTGGSGGRTAECSSRYNGSCNSECSGGNSSLCSSCKAACGLYAHAYYIKTPQSLMTTTVFGNEHHSYYSSFGNIGVQNAR